MNKPKNNDLALTQQLSFLDLGKLGVSNKDNYSHLIGLASNIPSGVPAKDKHKPLGVVEREFVYEDALVKTTLTGTKIKMKVDGKEQIVDAFPSVRENRIEEGLHYLSSHGQAALHSHNNQYILGVHYTYRGLKRILDELGYNYNIRQIKEGLEILEKSHLDVTVIHKGEKFTFSGTRIGGSLKYDREDWLKSSKGDESKGLGFCWLHPLFTHEISLGKHRLYDLSLASKLKSEVARDLYRRLCTRFTYASLHSSYNFRTVNFLMSTDRGLKEPWRQNFSHMEAAIKELQAQGIIWKYLSKDEHDDKLRPQRITDRVYDIYASESFIAYAKKANKLAPEKRSSLVRSYESVDGSVD